jgi:hypothetical protein
MVQGELFDVARLVRVLKEHQKVYSYDLEH